MYTQFFGFREKPFNLVPDPNYLFLSSRHEKALTFLEYGLAEKVGFIMLTGEVGIGKTTLIRYLLNQVQADTEVAVVFHTNVDAMTLLRQILGEFEISCEGAQNKADLLDRLYKFLIQRFAQGQKVFLIVDEAQNLSNEALEEIRMLSNLQTDKDLLVQVIIVGQPNLRDKIQSPELEQFAQRISASFHMSALTREETRGYVTHRLETAGGDPELFAPEVFDMLFTLSGGIPRTINLLCDALLVYGYADRAKVLTPGLLEQVVEDKGGMGVFTPGRRAEGVLQEEETGSDLENRIEALETRVAELSAALAVRLEETESRAEFCRDELVSRLGRLYADEKKRHKLLAYQYGKLKEKYLSLQSGPGEGDKGSET